MTEKLITIHNVFVYHFYKYVFFGLLFCIDILIGVEVIRTTNLDLLMGWIIVLLISIFLFFLFQYRFKKLYVSNDKVIVKGFFYGKMKLEKQAIVFQTKERPIFSELIELSILIKDFKKPYKIITNNSNVKNLKNLQFKFMEPIIKKWYHLW